MTKKWRIILILPAVAMIGSCSFRPVYNDVELALAREGVERFHQYFSLPDYDSLYSLMSAEARTRQSKEALFTVMQTTFEKWGKAESTTMIVEKVHPGPPVQVRTIYNTSFEKGKAQEWFIWVSDGKQASLMQYQV